MNIREGTEKDLPAILGIMNDAILHTTSIYDYHPRSAAYVQDWFEKKRQDGLPVIVCEHQGEAVGYGSYGIFRPWEAYQHSAEHSVYIREDSRGRGFGGKLLQALIDTARHQGFHTLIAGVDMDNESSRKLHRKFGFVEAGRLREVGFKFDKWLDLVFLQLMLREDQER